jgi:hypothetical protein
MTDTADATGTSGPGVEGRKEDLRTSTTETMKKPIRQADKKYKKDLLLLD